MLSTSIYIGIEKGWMVSVVLLIYIVFFNLKIYIYKKNIRLNVFLFLLKYILFLVVDINSFMGFTFC